MSAAAARWQELDTTVLFTRRLGGTSGDDMTVNDRQWITHKKKKKQSACERLQLRWRCSQPVIGHRLSVSPSLGETAKHELLGVLTRQYVCVHITTGKYFWWAGRSGAGGRVCISILPTREIALIGPIKTWPIVTSNFLSWERFVNLYFIKCTFILAFELISVTHQNWVIERCNLSEKKKKNKR